MDASELRIYQLGMLCSKSTALQNNYNNIEISAKANPLEARLRYNVFLYFPYRIRVISISRRADNGYGKNVPIRLGIVFVCPLPCRRDGIFDGTVSQVINVSRL